VTRNPPRDLAASVRQRLLNKAREEGRPYGELSRHFAMERFLYRLSRSPHAPRFVLKGALMFVVWRAPRSRPTMDIDLASLGSCDGEEVEGLIRSCCVQPVEPDGLRFDPATLKSTAILEQARYVGLRCRLAGSLGVERVTVQIDVAAGGSHEQPTLVAYPTLLDQPAPWVLGCSREIAVAEKLHAIVSRGEINTRLKDFYDLWLLSRHFRFDGEALSTAVQSVFRERDTAIPAAPIGLSGRFASDPARQTQWAAFVRKRLLEGAPREFWRGRRGCRRVSWAAGRGSG
jgi:nucleotidyltransferase AbiEii toxin of type IV toxin-antitoxin system